MVRFFGKPTAGAFTDPGADPSFCSNGYFCRVDPGCGYSLCSNERYLIHNTFPVDEEVWLTREGVAQGKDDVVTRALQWMDSLSYAHDVIINEDTVRTGADSITIVAQVENPGQHDVIVSAIVSTTEGSVVDSVMFVKAAVGSKWEAFVGAPHAPGRYNVSVRTDDVTSMTYRRLPNIAGFTSIVTGVNEDAENLPREFGLSQNYPNPFNPRTAISYQLPAVSKIKVVIYDFLGRVIAVVVNETKQPGIHQATWDASGFSSGIYFYRLTAENFVETRKMILIR